MTTQNRLRSCLLGLALGVLLTLLSSPTTRWLVRTQVAACGLAFATPAAQIRHANENRDRFLAAHPNDLQIQIANAVGGLNPVNGLNPQNVLHLRTLAPRFPNSPSLYANLLRYEVGSSADRNSVYLTRIEDYSVASLPLPKDLKIPPPPSAAVLAAFDADAAAGERLDPDNAYFPMMRAVGLFAGHHDDAAIAAVLRAGKASAWREYLQDDINGRLRLTDAADFDGVAALRNGLQDIKGHLRLADAADNSRSAMSHIAIFSSVLLPHYPGLRGVTRVSTMKAAQAESNGQVEQGMALRRALMHCGGLMRVNSTFLIGSLVGIAIAAIARARPGGAAISDASSGPLRGQEMAHRRLQAFCAYAKRVGHPEDAQFALAENAAGQEVQMLFGKAEDRSVFSTFQLTHLSIWWVSSLLTLANVFWLLVFGAAAAVLTRIPSVREGRAMPRPALWGIFILALTILLTALFLFNNSDNQNSVVMFVSLLAIPAIVGVMIIRWRRASPLDRREWGRNTGHAVRAFVLTSLALLVLSTIAVRQVQGVVGFADVLQGVTDLWGNTDGTSPALPQDQEIEAEGIVSSLSLPLLLVIVLSIAGRVRRVPVSVSVVNGFRGGSLPIACVLLIAYGALVLGTVRQDRMIDDGLRQMIQHEGRYYASLAGQKWPEMTP